MGAAAFMLLWKSCSHAAGWISWRMGNIWGCRDNSGTLEKVMLGDFNDSAATGTQPLAERSVLHSPLSWDHLEPGAAQRTVPNLAPTSNCQVPPGSSRRGTRHKVHPPLSLCGCCLYSKSLFQKCRRCEIWRQKLPVTFNLGSANFSVPAIDFP